MMFEITRISDGRQQVLLQNMNLGALKRRLNAICCGGQVLIAEYDDRMLVVGIPIRLTSARRAPDKSTPTISAPTGASTRRMPISVPTVAVITSVLGMTRDRPVGPPLPRSFQAIIVGGASKQKLVFVHLR
jgi:hypothetical protein